MTKHTIDLNRPIFELDDEHPAKAFLLKFLDCLEQCMGKQYPPPLGINVEQEWWSAILGREFTFSGFVYAYLAFDVELDGWLSGDPARTESEQATLAALPKLRALMGECGEAARRDDNQPILQMIETVTETLRLWEECILARVPD